MRLTVNLADNTLIPGPNQLGAVATANNPLTSMAGIRTPVELQFVDVDPATGLQTPRRLPDGTVIAWPLKLVKKYTGVVIVSVPSFTRPATEDGYYTGWLTTTEAGVLLALGDADSDQTNDLDLLALAGEITFLRPTETEVDRTAQHVYVTLLNYYSHAGDGTGLDPTPVFGTQRGTVALASGASSVTVTFVDAYASTAWIPLSLVLRNTTDATPAAIGIETMTAKTAGGFTLQLSGPTDSANYVLDYACASIPLTGSALLGIDSGWSANADAGDKTKVIPAAATIVTIAAALDVLVAGAGALLLDVAEKCKAQQTLLAALKYPDRA
jgi:hypothetical protein